MIAAARGKEERRVTAGDRESAAGATDKPSLQKRVDKSTFHLVLCRRLASESLLVVIWRFQVHAERSSGPKFEGICTGQEVAVVYAQQINTNHLFDRPFARVTLHESNCGEGGCGAQVVRLLSSSNAHSSPVFGGQAADERVVDGSTERNTAVIRNIFRTWVSAPCDFAERRPGPQRFPSWEQPPPA